VAAPLLEEFAFLGGKLCPSFIQRWGILPHRSSTRQLYAALLPPTFRNLTAFYINGGSLGITMKEFSEVLTVVELDHKPYRDELFLWING
jgi:hypothetical protein